MVAVSQAPGSVAPIRTPSRPVRLRAVQRRKQAVLRWVVVVIVLAFFVIPLLAMLDFTTKLLHGGRTGAIWSELAHVHQLSIDYPTLWTGIKNSLILVVLTVVIMIVLLVPTMTWIRLRLPALGRTVEFICLLPLTIPAIVLVVGLAPIYREIAHLTTSTSALWLCLAYVILVLPYAYRALDAGLGAIDVKTLSEAARSLGASWAIVMWRIVLPNIVTAVAGASFLAVALVLGEYTIASLLGRENLQTAIVATNGQEPRLATAISLVALIFGFLLMFVLTFVGMGRRARRRKGN